MTITISSTDPRSIKAVEIASTAGQWLKCRGHDGRKAFGVLSSDGTRHHLVDCQRCTCPDFEHRQQPCKHVLAVRLHVELTKAQSRRKEVSPAF